MNFPSERDFIFGLKPEGPQREMTIPRGRRFGGIDTFTADFGKMYFSLVSMHMTLLYTI